MHHFLCDISFKTRATMDFYNFLFFVSLCKVYLFVISHIFCCTVHFFRYSSLLDNFLCPVRIRFSIASFLNMCARNFNPLFLNLTMC